MKRLTLLFAFLLSFTAPAMAADGIRLLETPRTVADFTLPNTKGGTTSLSELHGRYVLINFWAVWCGPCREEMPGLEAVHQHYKDAPFTLLGVHVGPDMASAFMFSRRMGLTFPIVVDEHLQLEDFGVKALPTTVLVDPEGKVIAEAVGDRQWYGQAMLDRLNELMPAKP